MEGICDTPVVYGVTAGEDSGKVGRVSNLLVVPTVVVGEFRGGACSALSTISMRFIIGCACDNEGGGVVRMT